MATRRSGAAPTAQCAAAASAATDRISQMPPKRARKGMQQEANEVVRQAEKFAQEVTGTTLVDTVQTMSAQVLHVGPIEKWSLTTAHGVAAPTSFEKETPIPASTTKPCRHCGETFPGPPTMVFVPHIDDPKKLSGDGNWCGSACMMGFFRERRQFRMLTFAIQSAAMQGLQTAVEAPEQSSMRHWEGDHAPIREGLNREGAIEAAAEAKAAAEGADAEDGEVVEEAAEPSLEDRVVAAAKESSKRFELYHRRKFSGRFLPSCIGWQLRSVGTNKNNLGANMVTMVFPRQNGEVRGLTVPRGEDAPIPLKSRPMRRKGLFSVFADEVEKGVEPTKVVLPGVEARTTTNIRRARVGSVTVGGASSAAANRAGTASAAGVESPDGTPGDVSRTQIAIPTPTASVSTPADKAIAVAMLPRAARKKRKRDGKSKKGSSTPLSPAPESTQETTRQVPSNMTDVLRNMKRAKRQRKRRQQNLRTELAQAH